MCLAVPGRVVSIDENLAGALGPEGLVDFLGTKTRVSLVLVPQARVGSWVLVHAGMALEELDAEEASKTWSYLKEAGVLEGRELEADDEREAR
ncbi:MAG TPA: HypC/HybG/HupF family hydrogenase formation chaperone [Candidatus Krumholzibacteria bacterium]|nr:HypC/HybG/HupF family hydrogenase formation chaperone [Candidatus Krumholzibacteria bacterium]